MIKYKSSSSGGKLFWFFQRLTGFLLLFILLFHFFLIHFCGTETHMVTFEDVKARLVSPYWKTLDITFLFLALFHGFYGLWMISDDYFRRPWVRIAIFGVLCTLGLILAIFGSLTIINFPSS
ncbi:MAG: hypothetical protein J7M18_00920 [Candidatus Eremiobacteraeota bacterium]|nr:hypothetical protein [Candidatus Eremiobacteraeota bacterium]